MSTELPPDHDELKREIRKSLEHAEANAAHLKKTNTRLLIASIVTSAATTLVTAVAAASGPVVGDGTAGWQVSCAIAAVFGFATTVCVSLNQQLRLADRLSKANESGGRLKSLVVAMSAGSRDRDDIATEYAEIVRDYPEPLRRPR